MRHPHAAHTKSRPSTKACRRKTERISRRGPARATETMMGWPRRVPRASIGTTGAPWIRWPMRVALISTMWDGCRPSAAPARGAASGPWLRSPRARRCRARRGGPREVVRLARGEPRLRVAGMVRERRPLPSRQVSRRLGHDADAQARRQGPQHQVVVFGPATVGVARAPPSRAASPAWGAPPGTRRTRRARHRQGTARPFSHASYSRRRSVSVRRGASRTWHPDGRQRRVGVRARRAAAPAARGA
jgi:hypothetical protein